MVDKEEDMGGGLEDIWKDVDELEKEKEELEKKVEELEEEKSQENFRILERLVELGITIRLSLMIVIFFAGLLAVRGMEISTFWKNTISLLLGSGIGIEGTKQHYDN